MAKKGLLINYDYCTGCHTCEVACKQEHGYPAGRWGIMVKDLTRETVDKVQVDSSPSPPTSATSAPGALPPGRNRPVSSTACRPV